MKTKLTPAALAAAMLRQCRRCSHAWIRRDLGREPAVCPKCKSSYWNREKGGAR